MLSRRSITVGIVGALAGVWSNRRTWGQILSGSDSSQIDGSNEVSLEFFGAVGDGQQDCSDAFSRAVATGKTIRLTPNRKYKIGKAQVVRGDLRLMGGGVLSFVTRTQSAIECTGAVYIDGVIFDGNNISNEMIRVIKGRVEIKNTEVRNVFQNSPLDGVAGLRFNNCQYIHINNSRFLSICAKGNGVIGDALGAVAAIQISGDCGYALIENCYFSNINNRISPTGARQFEDADAIRTTSGGRKQNVTIRSNRFEDCGKRAAKFMGTVDSSYIFEKNLITSSYINEDDTRSTLGNGMYAIVSCYGGSLDISDNRVTSGIIGYFFEGGTPNLRALKIVNNTVVPQNHRYVNTNVSRFININKDIPGGFSASIDRNDSGGMPLQ